MQFNKKKIKPQKKKILKEFTGKKITRYAGLSSFATHIFYKLGLVKDMESLFPSKIENATKFTTTQVLLSIILASLSGINRISKIAIFTNDVLIQTLLNLPKGINKDKFPVILKGLGNRGANLLMEYFLLKTSNFLRKEKLSNITLDVDSSVINVCGNQEGSAKGFNSTKKGSKSYHPLIGFISEFKIVANSWFRTGSAYTSNGICEFVKQTATMFPENIKKVFFRADSGFFNGKLFDLLEDLKYDYLVKVKLYSNISELLKNNIEWIPYKYKNETVSICEFEYKGKEWSKPRIFKAIRTLIGYEEIDILGIIHQIPKYQYACYCSNLNLNGYKLHEKYVERSTSETWIEQVKNQLNAGKTLTDNFDANDILWQLSVAAYNYSVMARFKWHKFFRQEHSTFKDWFINVPALLISSGRRTILKIYKHYHAKIIWKEYDDLLLGL